MMRFIKDENGQGMLEYVLIIALVALVLVGTLFLIRDKMKSSQDIKNIEGELNKIK